MPAEILLAQDQTADEKLGIDLAHAGIAIAADDLDPPFLDALPELVDHFGPILPRLDEKRLELLVDGLELPDEFRILPHEHQIVVDHFGIAVFVPGAGMDPRPIAMRGDIDDRQLRFGRSFLPLGLPPAGQRPPLVSIRLPFQDSKQR